MTNEEWLSQMENLGVPKRYHAVSQELRQPAELSGWTGDPWAVTLLGPAGSGKTWIAVHVLALLWGARAGDGFVGRIYRPRFFDVSEAIVGIKRDFDAEQSKFTYEHMVNGEAVVLDDLGAERETDFTKDQVSSVLRARYNSMRPTIITSNATKLSELGDQRIASRLSDGIVITLSGKDRRGRHAF